MLLQNTWNGEMSFGGQAKQVALCLDANNCLEMFYVGTNGHLYQSIQQQPNNVLFSKAVRFSNDSGKQIVLIQDGSGQLNLFYIGSNGHIFQNIQTDVANNLWSGENALNVAGTQIALVLDGGGLLHIFWIGSKKLISHMRQQAVGSTQWVDQVEFAGEPALAIAAVANARNVRLFFIAKDGSLWRRNQSDLQFSDWSSASIPFNVHAAQFSAAVDSLGFAHIFYVAANDQLFHNWQTDALSDAWIGQTPFAGEVGKEIICVNTALGLQTFFTAKNDDLYTDFETNANTVPPLVNEPNNANWNGKVLVFGPRGKGNAPKAKQVAAAANQDGHLEIFYVGENDDIYRNWQIVTPGTLGSNCNDVLTAQQGQALSGVSVTVTITEPVTAYEESGPSSGFSFQLNCNSVPGHKCTWQQYIFGFYGDTLAAVVNNWGGWKQELCNQKWNLKSNLPNKSIPVGYRLIIQLYNDESGNVHEVVFGVVDNAGHAIAKKKANVQSLVGGKKNIAPIQDMTMNLVGPVNGQEVILSSGAGTIAYTSDFPLSATQGGSTQESGNSFYTLFTNVPSTNLEQRFSVILDEKTVLASPQF